MKQPKEMKEEELFKLLVKNEIVLSTPNQTVFNLEFTAKLRSWCVVFLDKMNSYSKTDIVKQSSNLYKTVHKAIDSAVDNLKLKAGLKPFLRQFVHENIMVIAFESSKVGCDVIICPYAHFPSFKFLGEAEEPRMIVTTWGKLFELAKEQLEDVS